MPERRPKSAISSSSVERIVRTRARLALAASNVCAISGSPPHKARFLRGMRFDPFRAGMTPMKLIRSEPDRLRDHI